MNLSKISFGGAGLVWEKEERQFGDHCTGFEVFL